MAKSPENNMMKMIIMSFMMVLVLAPHGDATISCNTVYNTLYPCISYVIGSGPLQQSCCGGIKSLYAAAKMTSDRQSVCTCLKNMAANANGNAVFIRNAASLPGQCGVSIPYPISPNVNCASVK